MSSPRGRKVRDTHLDEVRIVRPVEVLLVFESLGLLRDWSETRVHAGQASDILSEVRLRALNDVDGGELEVCQLFLHRFE